jgi:hypothetical protein
MSVFFSLIFYDPYSLTDTSSFSNLAPPLCSPWNCTYFYFSPFCTNSIIRAILLSIHSIIFLWVSYFISSFWWWLRHCSAVLDFMKFDILWKIFFFFLVALPWKWLSKRVMNFKKAFISLMFQIPLLIPTDKFGRLLLPFGGPLILWHFPTCLTGTYVFSEIPAPF